MYECFFVSCCRHTSSPCLTRTRLRCCMPIFCSSSSSLPMLVEYLLDTLGQALHWPCAKPAGICGAAVFQRPWVCCDDPTATYCMTSRQTGLWKRQGGKKYLRINLGRTATGKRVYLSAHVFLCWLMRGPPPRDQETGEPDWGGFEASHIRANGCLGHEPCSPSCLNPLHLRWQTPLQNKANGSFKLRRKHFFRFNGAYYTTQY